MGLAFLVFTQYKFNKNHNSDFGEIKINSLEKNVVMCTFLSAER